ncbi:hypothetical protein PT287_08325 [Lactobacillus sp. ESL0679]|uniref:hypothetical protein n=1 Tax=Lactobacillus sp. ESL0679 TaxID=2983209 RepID=UPI0023F908CB|nr:hypothetical protein [Lactobacillus sp. ESL0679]MDF7683503.1 hypothetical protein [Lactobacillus sp. ESL0679]
MTAIPYDLIHKIEAKYGTLAIPDSEPLMIELHRVTGVKVRKQRNPRKVCPYKYKPHYYDDQIVQLIKDGYSIGETASITGHARQTVNLIIDHYHLKLKQPFICQYQSVYLSSLSNLAYWGIKARSTESAKRRTHGEIMVKKFHWCDIPIGGKYMINGNDTEIFVK